MKGGHSIFFFCFLMLGAVVIACTHSGTSDESGSRISGTIVGSEGGTVTMDEAGNGISGAKVYVPPDALEGEEGISLISTQLPAPLPVSYKAAGQCISFNPDGTTFKQPVKLYLPYTDVNNDGIIDGKAVAEAHVGVLYYNEQIKQWEKMSLSGRDTGSNLAIVETVHFSTYLAIIDTTNSQPLDSGTPTNTTSGSTAPALASGDCLVGNGNILTNTASDTCYYYNLSITRRESGLNAIVDRHATFVETGIPATVSAEGDSATFDAASAFSKVLLSGDAAKWNWEAEFVKEHTYLNDYEVKDDALSSTGSGDTGAGIYCTISATDANMVKISWQINVNDQILYQTSPQGNGHCLVIRFRATYQ